MASHQVINVTLPILSQDWSSDKDFKAVGTLSAAIQRNLEPVGPHFLAHARRKRHQRTFSEDERIQAQQNVKKTEDDEDDEISEAEDPMMLSRDAKDWKAQDHYAVLGLSKYRWRATPEQIKRAHRKKVLRHHPDKKAALGDRDENDNFFKCIQKANELLTDPVKRRQFDSVDEAADVDPPSKKDLTKRGFYKSWGPVFVAEGRFSKTQPVPKLGDENSTQEEVEAFYNFFYNFDSWRTFEYLDEDVPDDNENRDQKRHVEKKNANARRKRKTEDTARLRHLVDDCLAQDERIKKFRQQARAGKDKKRLEKEAEAKRLAEEKEKARLEEEQRKKDAEENAKAEREKNKKAKEAAKNAAKKNKRVLKGSVKDVNYFAESGEPSAAQVDSVLGDVELIMGKIDAEELASLAERLNAAGKDGAAVKGVWAEEAQRLVGAGKLKDGEVKAFA
ncbi:putative ribosome associated DnaJ chaperone Zuotin [Aspergillus clavatus NRRL 1]|uniref:Ribosome associated DnaJ chaperone Zuotin, putative n=1 Tax=Aspergillus clavatus (strain ATCC 1007 / CBS 513.65 / DSM 816 / NCTC 3887 / NRRL 1 / QM 1276 / 107) TaxID=344612 RepID=A1C9A4_ASPCL|nr:ribosome associated DnaJ chaperone Zuotin, putative [Aspergillus clavatus NRRL 1]EAW13428.1 ribosome associated DnaJ chaperone Zuotin, putative [Aspergillus clavatus NRRL 1]